MSSKGLFAKDCEFPVHTFKALLLMDLQTEQGVNAVPAMMYGFGDDKQPYAETVDVVEVLQALHTMLQHDVSRMPGSSALILDLESRTSL